MKDMESGDSKRMEWESEIEYQYRANVHGTIKKVAQILSNLEKIKENPDYDCTGLRESIKKALNEIMATPVPEMYTESNKVILNSIKTYKKALDFLIEGLPKRDVPATYKAGRYIQEGNAWMAIAKTRIWEEVGKKEGKKNAESRNL